MTANSETDPTNNCSAVLAEAIRIRNGQNQEIGYGCHTKSGYSDGYGDAQYGDYEDAV